MRRLLAACGLAALSSMAWAQPTPPAFRLDDTAVPVAYEVHLAIDPDASRFTGEVRIDVRVARAAPRLWLNASHLDIRSARALQDGREVALRVEPGGEDFVGLESTGAPLAPGAATLRIVYEGRLDEVSTRGLFREREEDAWYVLSQFEALSARRAFPCFDEPGFKTPWELTIDAPAADRVVSNTEERLAYDLAERPGWRRHAFVATPPLPSYLVALAVGPFDVVQGAASAHSTPLRYVAPKGRGAETRFAQEATPRLLAILEDYFGRPYPFAKLDTVAIPAAASFGAMENAGMITYQSTLLLAKPFEETLRFRRDYASVGAHELAHQWVGDLVTLAWWDDTWLNEALATWMARKAVAAYHEPWDGGWPGADARRRALDADRLASARAVHNPVLAKTDVYGAFDPITYEKGGEVLAMFEQSLGVERFRDGVRAYLTTHVWDNATARDFFAAIGAASGAREDTVAAFGAFIEHPGAPMLDVALRCEGGAPRLEVSQQRFRPVGSHAPDQAWTTPACFRFSADGSVRTQCAQVHNGAQTVELAATRACPDWLVANAGGVGDYLARYDVALLQRNADHVADIPEPEAIAFAGDSELLARTGLLPIDDALVLAGLFLRHPSVSVKHGGVAMLDRLPDAWLDARRLEAKRDAIRRDVLPLARRVGWVEHAQEDDAVRELRSQLLPLAARYEPRETLKLHARELAYRWLVNRPSIPAMIAEPALGTAARFAEGPAYARLEAGLHATRDRHDRNLLLRALAAVREPKARERVLALALDARLDGREALTLLEKMLWDEWNRGPAFAWLRTNFDAVVAKLPEDTPAYFVTALGTLCTPQDRDAFVSFFAGRAPRFLGGAKRYAEALESIDLCVAARQAAP